MVEGSSSSSGTDADGTGNYGRNSGKKKNSSHGRGRGRRTGRGEGKSNSEGKRGDSDSGSDDSGSDDEDEDENESSRSYVPQDYKFSSIPEVESVEKKLRQVGRLTATKGTDVEQLFLKFDRYRSGSIFVPEACFNILLFLECNEILYVEVLLWHGDDLTFHEPQKGFASEFGYMINLVVS